MVGDIDTFIGNLTRPQTKKEAGECVRSLLNQLRIRELLLVGIDLAWDQVILSAIPSHLETIWFINEDDHVKDKFIDECENIKDFRYLTGHKGSYEHFFKLLYWNIKQSTESHKLIEDVKIDMHNMRIDLNRIEKIGEKTSADMIERMKLLQAQVGYITRLLEDISANRRLEGD